MQSYVKYNKEENICFDSTQSPTDLSIIVTTLKPSKSEGSKSKGSKSKDSKSKDSKSKDNKNGNVYGEMLASFCVYLRRIL